MTEVIASLMSVITVSSHIVDTFGLDWAVIKQRFLTDMDRTLEKAQSESLYFARVMRF